MQMELLTAIYGKYGSLWQRFVSMLKGCTGKSVTMKINIESLQRILKHFRIT